MKKPKLEKRKAAKKGFDSEKVLLCFFQHNLSRGLGGRLKKSMNRILI